MKPTGVSFSFGPNKQISVLRENSTAEVREDVLANFSCLCEPLLITNDIAVEDLKLRDVPILINYDVPHDIETFIGRHSCVGRKQMLSLYYSFPHQSDDDLRLMNTLLQRDWKMKEDLNKPSAISFSFFNKPNSDIAMDLVLLEEVQEEPPPFLNISPSSEKDIDFSFISHRLTNPMSQDLMMLPSELF